MKLRVLVVGRSSPAWADAAVEDYARRLRPWGGVQEESVKPELFRGDVEAVRVAEGARLRKRIGPRDRLIVLDERGDALSTEAFTELVERSRNGGVHQLVFALGGPYGHDPALREHAWRVVRLSSLVMNHEVARVVLYEQLYRAMTLVRGMPYHH